jgi:hypothetical protein
VGSDQLNEPSLCQPVAALIETIKNDQEQAPDSIGALNLETAKRLDDQSLELGAEVHLENRWVIGQLFGNDAPVMGALARQSWGKQ